MLELLAPGWMAPVFGGGIDVWAVVLGITLTAMAAGYFLGSWRTKRLANPASLALLICLVGLAALGCTLAGRAWMRPEAAILSTAGLLAMASLLLALPILLLAVITPWLVQVYATIRGIEAGRASGVMYAVSTLGGVAGALTTGLWMIPRLGLWQTTVASLWVLMVAVSVCVIGTGRRRLIAAIAACLLLAAAAAAQWYVHPSKTGEDDGAVQVLLREDSWYGRREVIDDGMSRYLLVNGILQTSSPLWGREFFTPGELLASGNALELLPYLRPEGRRALLIGLGGGSLWQTFTNYGWTVTSVEIDPGVVKIAREYFDYDGPCHITDGRRFLNGCDESFDFIILDVYRGEDLPAHLATREFFGLVRRRLTADGLFAMNLIGAVGTEDTGALLRTVRSVFPNMALFAPGGGEFLGPMTLIASPTNLLHESTLDRLASRGLAFPAQVDLDKINLKACTLLTDDRNPIRMLRRRTARAWRAASLRRYRFLTDAAQRKENRK